MFISESDFIGFTKGTETSFDNIFKQYFKTLVSFSARHGLELMEAEDIVLDTFHNLWRIRAKVKSAATLHTLLFISVRNKTLNVIRNVNNRKRIIDTIKLDVNDSESNNFIVEEEVARLLDSAIDKLPRQCKTVILASLAGKKLPEIAQEMKLSINSVKTYRLRGIEQLRDSLKDYPFVLSALLILLNAPS